MIQRDEDAILNFKGKSIDKIEINKLNAGWRGVKSPLMVLNLKF